MPFRVPGKLYMREDGVVVRYALSSATDVASRPALTMADTSRLAHSLPQLDTMVESVWASLRARVGRTRIRPYVNITMHGWRTAIRDS